MFGTVMMENKLYDMVSPNPIQSEQEFQENDNSNLGYSI